MFWIVANRARRVGGILLASCFLLWVTTRTASGQTARPITEAASILAIYTQDWQLGVSDPVKIVVAAWEDGNIVWSEDRLNGGPPYRTARLGPSRLEEFLSSYETDGVFELDGLKRQHLGPDSAFTTMVLKTNGKQLEMRSWHELIEGRKQGNVRESGVFSPQRPRLQVLQEESREYLFYRFVWTEIRARALSLIPTEGELVDGNVIMESGKLSWQQRE